MFEGEQLELEKQGELGGQLGEFKMVKLALNGDYIAKNKLGEKYLLCHMYNRTSCEYKPQLLRSHIIQCEQAIKEQKNTYEGFLLPNKLVWIGDTTALVNKSELHCLALLYSAVKNIVKPLVEHSHLISGVSNYLSIDNLWFRDHSCFMFLCKRKQSRSFHKTQQVGKFKHRKLAHQEGSKEQLIVSEFGSLFWSAFFPDVQSIQNEKRATFREIVKAMIKKQLSLSELLKIMEEKSAKKKFISQFNPDSGINFSNLGERYERKMRDTIDYEDMENRFDNLQVSSSPKRHLLVQKPQRKSFKEKSNRISIDIEDSSLPPSFISTKRGKRYSLFQQKSNRNNRYENTDRQQQFQTMSISHGKPFSKTITATGFNSPANYVTLNITSKASKVKNRRQLRTFEEINNNQLINRRASKIQVFQNRSKEKALNSIQRSVDRSLSYNSHGRIDDRKFKEKLKEKSELRKKNINQILSQTSKALSRVNADGSNPAPLKSFQFSSRMMESQENQFQPTEKVQRQIKVFNENNVSNKIQTKYSIQQQENQYFVEREEPIVEKKKLEQNYEKYESNRREDNLFSKNQVTQIPIDTSPLFKKFDKTQVQNDPKISAEKVPSNKEITPYKQTRTENQKYSSNKNIVKEEKKEEGKKRTENQKYSSNKNIVKEEKKEEVKRSSSRDPRQMKKQEQNQVKKEKPNNYFDTAIQEEIPSVSSVKFIEKQKKEEAKQNKTVEKPKIVPAKSEKVIKNMFPNKKDDFNDIEDELEEVTLVSTVNQKKINTTKQIQPSVSTKSIPSPSPPPTQPPKKERKQSNEIQQAPKGVKQDKKEVQRPSSALMAQSEIKKTSDEVRARKDSMQRQGSKERVKTGQSNTSSNAGKSVRKQIDQYIYMINKMGEAVAKTAKISKKLQGIDWYVGVYFLYKRFFYERKKIQKYLLEEIPKLTRYEVIGFNEWKQWLKKGERDTLLNKCQEDNKNIEESLKKMAKKIQAMNLPASIANNIPITKNIGQSSLYAIECIMNQYDQIGRMKLLDDPDIYTHINEMINGLYVMSELDDKLQEKKSVLEYGNIKRTKKELKQIVKTILNFYYQEED